MTATMVEPVLFREREATEFLAIGRSKLWELIAEGQIPIVRIGRAVRIPRSGLVAFVERQIAQQATDAGGPAR